MKILLIAPAIYEKTDVVGIVQRALYHNLYKENVELFILCNTHGVKDLESENCHVIKVTPDSLVEFLFKVFKRTKLRDVFMTPDYIYHAWGKKAIKTGIEIVKKHGIDLVQSCSNPVCSHVVACQIAKKTGIKWVAQFYDPFYLNPYRKIRWNCIKDRDLLSEKKIAEKADAIIHNSAKMCGIWQKRYGKVVENKLKALPMSVNFPSKSNYVKREDNSRFVISHIGNFYQERNAISFIEAVASLKESCNDFVDRLAINLIGDVTEGDRSLIEKYNLTNIFNLVGRISEQECDNYYRNSDAFIAIDAPIDETEVCFYPSKLLKYFYWEKPIIGVSPINSVLSNELDIVGHPQFENKDINGLASFLQSILTEGLHYQFKADYWKNFESDKVAKQYVGIIKEVIKK